VLVKFRAFNGTCAYVSLACPISSDVFIHAKLNVQKNSYQFG